MRRLVPALLLLMACGPAAPRTSASGADPGPALVRVVTWNVHDLFDELDRRAPPGALDEVPPAAEVEGKLEAVAQVLRRLDADLVLLQEVEDLPLLARLAPRAGYPEAHLVEGNDPRGIDVALLSRLPVRRYLSHAGEAGADGSPRWPRDAVEAEVQAGAQRLVLVGSHLSSHLSDPSGARRSLQAAGLRRLADGLSSGGALVVVAGDLNDEASAPALAPLFGDGRWVDATGSLPAAEAWTWSGASGRSALDHLAVRSEEGWRVAGAWVAGGEAVAGASDHRPVVADLLLR